MTRQDRIYLSLHSEPSLWSSMWTSGGGDSRVTACMRSEHSSSSSPSSVKSVTESSCHQTPPPRSFFLPHLADDDARMTMTTNDGAYQTSSRPADTRRSTDGDTTEDRSGVEAPLTTSIDRRRDAHSTRYLSIGRLHGLWLLPGCSSELRRVVRIPHPFPSTKKFRYDSKAPYHTW